MIYENEVIMFLLGLGALVFALLNYSHLKSVRSFGILFAGFCVLFAAWILTVLEHLFWEAELNLLEHACYAVCGILVAFWCWSVSVRAEESK